MPSTICLNYYKRPGSILPAILALFGRSKNFYPEKPLPKITAKWENIKIDNDRLSEFNRICQIKNSEYLSLIFPFTLVYPVLQRILSHKAAPLSMFKVLNSRIQIFQYRNIGINETLSVHSELTGYRIRPKGLEIDIQSAVNSDGKTAWKNIQTFYYKGRFGAPDQNYSPPNFNPIADPGRLFSWFLPEGLGYSFAKISGDGNPIHYSKIWARMLGFERDFAQPLLILANSVERLTNQGIEDKTGLDAMLKGQVYYEKNIIVKGTTNDDDARFDIYCEGNPLPSICGKLQTENSFIK